MAKYKPKFWIDERYQKETASGKHPTVLFNLDLFKEARKKINKKKKWAKREVKRRISIKDQNIIDWSRRTMKAGKDSKAFYANDKKRHAARELMLTMSLGPRSAIDKRDPDLYLTGGVAGSGKSYGAERLVAENEGVSHKKLGQAVTVVNPDDFKSTLVSYENKHSTNPNYRKTKNPLLLANSSYFHRESAELADKQFDRAVRERRDIILDRTQRLPTGIKKQVKFAKKHGYDVHEIGVFVRPSVAVGRAVSRFLSTGRYIQASYITANHKMTHNSILKVSKDKNVDTYAFLDNSPKYANKETCNREGSIWNAGDCYSDYKKPAMIGRNTRYSRVLKAHKGYKLKRM